MRRPPATPEEELQACERALAEHPDDLEVLLDAAELHVSRLQSLEPDRELLERGLTLARRGAALANRAGEPEWVGEFALQEGRAFAQLGCPREALERLDAALRALPGDVDVQLERGLALYELCRFAEARAQLAAVAREAPDDALAQHSLGLVCERLGDAAEAERRFSRARRLAPDDFPKPITLLPEELEARVEAALAELPEPVRRYLENVAIQVEDLPPTDDLLAEDPPLSPSILGLFRGASLGEKASSDPWSHFPSCIVLYQKNLERLARDERELTAEIRVTLLHEVGHFLGLDEEELYQRGLD
ncbi:MAG TPA: metallopeptidase family protein [Anaeromyxobacteraceae bacterium]|jgi:predicted Zn-dependent protease with MMP-like domain|nr:metallopeptidase family protein [Anaeromyxobacteraceae bacterium]